MPNDHITFRGGSISVFSDPNADTFINVVLRTPGRQFLSGEMRLSALKFSNENGKEKIEMVLTGYDLKEGLKHVPIPPREKPDDLLAFLDF